MSAREAVNVVRGRTGVEMPALEVGLIMMISGSNTQMKGW